MIKYFTLLFFISLPVFSQAQFKTGSATENILGNTYYDIQTQSSIGRRIVVNEDGNRSAVWMKASYKSSYPDRGTGYNYFEGNSWQSSPSSRIESFRTGWPEITATKNGTEIIAAHTADKIVISRRMPAGAGSWSFDSTSLNLPGFKVFWPRIAAGGISGNTIHLIALTDPSGATYNGQKGSLLYSRSEDAGATWNIKNVSIPEIDKNFYLGFEGDNYSIDCFGDTVAILIGGPDRDVVLLKSIDKGSTWNKTIITKFPILKYDASVSKTDTNNNGIADTLLSNDGSLQVLLDKNAKAHVFYGKMRVYCDNPGTGSGQGLKLITSTDSLMYWNEYNPGIPARGIAGVIDINHDNKINLPEFTSTESPFGVYLTGMTSMPSAGLDSSGIIYLCYSSIVEVPESSVPKAYRHTYIIKSTDRGISWSAPSELTFDAYTEEVYASVARMVDNHIHIVLQRDFYPGVSISLNGGTSPDPENKGQENLIVYKEVTKDLDVGMNKLKSEPAFTIFPNPASEAISVRVYLQGNEYTFRIKTITGEDIFEKKIKTQPDVYNLHFSLSDYPAGLYFLELSTPVSRITKKLVKTN